MLVFIAYLILCFSLQKKYKCMKFANSDKVENKKFFYFNNYTCKYFS